ncbi:ComEA family DNA-binding protein [Streptomyces sp. NPDC048275]|uniref:ComEA family DNA-binding protein n=1 Tax=Streptomyces sp. NPDC048275 TaxID=3155629 RepID=UPI0033C81BB1
MALRSRSRTATPTSGPGRGPVSDGRTRHRRNHPRNRPGNRTRRHEASAEALRLRAQALFPETGKVRGKSGNGPPGVDRDVGAPRARTSAGVGVAHVWGSVAPPLDGAVKRDASGSGPVGDAPSEVPVRNAAGVWRERAGSAVRERMPLWLQSRCGLERKSVAALMVLLSVAAVFALQHFWAGRTQSVRAPEVVRAVAPYGGQDGQDGEDGANGAGGQDAAAGRKAAQQPGTSAGALNPVGSAGTVIVVDVRGKVRSPGLQRLSAGSRVEDALRAAGGVRPGANTEGLNRARLLVDGEQVVVGAPAPVAGTVTGGGIGVTGTGGSASGVAPSAPVPLNTATVDQLDILPGVGPVLAQHIIEYRTQHGGFRSVDELREVNGIGDRRFADLQNLVRL